MASSLNRVASTPPPAAVNFSPYDADAVSAHEHPVLPLLCALQSVLAGTGFPVMSGLLSSLHPESFVCSVIWLTSSLLTPSMMSCDGASSVLRAFLRMETS